jgi:glycosyltransferase involved in cell wall biosynthesis
VRRISVVIPVYRDGARAVDAVRGIEEQSLPAGWTLEIIVVDDSSGDDTLEHVRPLQSKHTRILALPRNLGRSGARNAGADLASGECIVFMDCDCVPVGDGFIAAHLQRLEQAVASTGRVIGDDRAFWSRYQSDASHRRRRQHARGMGYAGSSQNLAVRTQAFRAIGGFDTGYEQYGFEDRDVLLRLARVGAVAWADDAVVRHRDALCMRGVARKMEEAGRHSSTRFASMHPGAYDALGYGRLDARRHGKVVQQAARAAARAVPLLASCVDGLIALPLPYALQAWAVRGTSALAYLCGTARADASAPSPNR